MKNRLLLILLVFFMGYRVNFIGSISVTELFVLTQIPQIYIWVKKRMLICKDLHGIVWGFIVLMLVQCVSEFIIGNSFYNAIRGVMVTVMALLLMLFFIKILSRDILLIKWVPIGNIMSLVIWGDQFGFMETGEATYFKFYYAPLVVNALFFVLLQNNKNIREYDFVIIFLASLFCISGGARSLGFSLFLVFFLYLIWKKYKSIKLKKLLPSLVVCLFLVQLFLTYVYMPKVKSGEWGSDQNRAQYEKINWRSDIFSIIMSSRSDFYISWIAFLDKPLFGHGAWAVDTHRKYYRMQLALFDEKNIKDDNLRYVPCHSVVVGKGVANGFFAFAVFLWICIKMYKIGILGLSVYSSYNVYTLWIVFSSFQHLLFGPPAILKNNSAISFAIMYTMYYFILNKKKQDENSSIVCCNCNI